MIQKLTKPFLCSVLSLVLCVGLLPVPAYAAESPSDTAAVQASGATELVVAGTSLDEGYYRVEGNALTTEGADASNYQLHYDATNAVATLNNFSLETTVTAPSAYGMIATGDVTLKLQGKNSLEVGSDTAGYGIYVRNGALTVEGGDADMLTVKATGASGRIAALAGESDIYFTGGTVELTAESSTVQESYGLYATAQQLVLSGAAKLSTQASNATRESAGISVGSLTLSDNASVTAAGGVAARSVGVYSRTGTTLEGAAQLTAQGADLTQTGTSVGLQSDGAFSMSDSGAFVAQGGAGAQQSTGVQLSATNDTDELSVSGNATIEATGGADATYSTGLLATGLALSFTDASKATLKGGANASASSRGASVEAAADQTNVQVTLADDAQLLVSGSNATDASYGLVSDSAELTVRDGGFVAQGGNAATSEGVHSATAVTLENGYSRISGESAAFSQAPKLADDYVYSWRADTADNSWGTQDYMYDTDQVYTEFVPYVLGLDKTEIALSKGQTVQLLPQVEPVADREVVWTSSDSSIATVSKDGTVSPVADGSTTIVASMSGTIVEPYTWTLSASAVVTVSGMDKPEPDTDVTLSYEENGGRELNDVSAKVGEEVVLATPLREGYTFNGWFTDQDFATPAVGLGGAVMTLDGDTTLYASWTKTATPAKLTTQHVNYVLGRIQPDGSRLIAPLENITRAEVATLIYRLLSEDVRNQYHSTTSSFTDVDPNGWYIEPVATLANMGIIAGDDAGTFRPDSMITRSEAITLIARLDAYYSDNGQYGSVPFSDVEDSYWAYIPLSFATNRGWLMGDDLGATLRPDASITRAEALAILNRVANRMPETVDDLLPGRAVFADNADPNAWYYITVEEAANNHTHQLKPDNYHETWTALLENLTH